MLKRNHKIIIALCSLLIFITLIQESYAKYLTSANANTSIAIARWNVLVNTRDVVNNSDFSNKITPIFPGNTHTSQDIIAPLSEGYFDLVIDFNAVDVSFKQVITLGHADSNTISDLVFTGYSVNGGVTTTINDTTKVITDNVLLTDITRVKTFRVYVKWIDGTGEEMDNEDDTEATRSGTASIKVDIDFEQIPE